MFACALLDLDCTQIAPTNRFSIIWAKYLLKYVRTLSFRIQILKNPFGIKVLRTPANRHRQVILSASQPASYKNTRGHRQNRLRRIYKNKWHRGRSWATMPTWKLVKRQEKNKEVARQARCSARQNMDDEFYFVFDGARLLHPNHRLIHISPPPSAPPVLLTLFTIKVNHLPSPTSVDKNTSGPPLPPTF